MIGLCWHFGPIVAGFLLDQLFGDPHWLPHPVRGIGWLIDRMEGALRRCFPSTERGLLWAGRVLAAAVPLLCWGASALVLVVCSWIHPWLAFGVESVMCYQILALKCLRDESMAVYRPIVKGDLPAARQAVSRIVGRDTQVLSMEGVTKAAVETVAENTSDGVVAPLFYLFLAGPLGGFFYKAVNTMDSMVGYQNERYQYFGTAAARLDDVMNWIPARLSALFMMVSALPCGYSVREAWRIYRRDRRNHKSPNAAQTEAVMAGALGIRLAGDAWYFGKRYPKPFIGDASRPVEREDILRAGRLEYATAVTAFAAFAVLRLAAAGLWPW